MYRILLDPDSQESGAADAPAEEIQGQEQAKPTPKPKPAPKPAGRTISDDDWAAYEQLKTEREDRERQRLADEEDKARQKGDFEKLIKAREAKAAAAEKRAEDEALKARASDERARKYAASREINAAIASVGPKLASPAVARHLEKLIAGDFEVTDSDDGGFSVTHKETGQDVTAWISEAIKTDEFAHFVKAEHRGGNGSRSGGQASPSASKDGKIAYVDHVADQIKQQQDGSPAHYVGLGRRR